MVPVLQSNLASVNTATDPTSGIETLNLFIQYILLIINCLIIECSHRGLQAWTGLCLVAPQADCCHQHQHGPRAAGGGRWLQHPGQVAPPRPFLLLPGGRLLRLVQKAVSRWRDAAEEESSKKEAGSKRFESTASTMCTRTGGIRNILQKK